MLLANIWPCCNPLDKRSGRLDKNGSTPFHYTIYSPAIGATLQTTLSYVDSHSHTLITSN